MGCYVATLCPSEGQYYHRLGTGINARMGDIVSQDRSYTLELMHTLFEMYELECQEHGYSVPMVSIYSVMFLIATCLGGMRGYEAVWADLDAIRYDVTHCLNHEDESAVTWHTLGRFNVQDEVLDYFIIPIAKTAIYDIKFFLWTQRFLCRLFTEEYENG